MLVPSVVLVVTASLLASCGSRLSRSEIRSAGSGTGDAVLSSEGSGASTSSGSSGTDGSAVTSGDAATATTGAVAAAPGTTVSGGTTAAVTGTATGGTTGGTTGAAAATTTGGTTTGGTTTGTTGSAPTGGGATGGTTGSAVASPAINTGSDAPIFGGNHACSPAKGSTVNLGNVSTLSGVLGQLFSPVVPALQTFVKAQNACGGLNGHPMKLFLEDDQGDPSTARTACQDQIQNDKIIAFVGNIQVLTIDGMKSCIDKSGIPIVGGDLTNNTWFGDPLLFPQGPPPQAISYGFLEGMVKRAGKKNIGDIYCIEVPQACLQIDKAFKELAPGFGANVVSSIQLSITAPSYTSQCLAAQDKKVEAIALIVDAPTQNRYADSCAKVGYKPVYVSYPLGVGNEGQFLGNPNLANTYVPLNTFPWMGKATKPEQFYQASVAKYNPGFTTGDAASLGWTAGALLVAGSKNFDPDKPPTTQQLLDGLYSIKGNNLGGLTAPLTFVKGGHPKVPYCLFAAVSNANNSGWATPVSIPVCTTTRAPSTPS